MTDVVKNDIKENVFKIAEMKLNLKKEFDVLSDVWPLFKHDPLGYAAHHYDGNPKNEKYVIRVDEFQDNSKYVEVKTKELENILKNPKYNEVGHEIIKDMTEAFKGNKIPTDDIKLNTEALKIMLKIYAPKPREEYRVILGYTNLLKEME